MFPFHDRNPSGKKPYVTYTLIVMDCLLFWGTGAIWIIIGWYRTFTDNGRWFRLSLVRVKGLNTHHGTFLHGGFWHMAGNMRFLHIFGDNLEDEMDHGKFFVFFFCVPWLQGLYEWSLIHTHLFMSSAPRALLRVSWSDIFSFTRKLKLIFCSYYWFSSKFSACLLGLSLDFGLHFSCLMAVWFPLTQQEWPIGRISGDLLRGFFCVAPLSATTGQQFLAR